MKKTSLFTCLIIILCALPIHAHDPMTINPPIYTYHYSIKVQVAHPDVNWPAPIRWVSDVYAPDLTSSSHYYACSLAVIPYTTPPTYTPPIPAGPVEFPGYYLDEVGSPLASWCFFDAQPGDCVRLNIKEFESPDLFGHLYRVISKMSC